MDGDLNQAPGPSLWASAPPLQRSRVPGRRGVPDRQSVVTPRV